MFMFFRIFHLYLLYGIIYKTCVRFVQFGGVKMGDNVDFGELSGDVDLKNRILEFEKNLKEVEKVLKTFCSIQNYNDLTPPDKVRYELFQAFAMNSLFWFYLRIKGIDPNQHDIRSELNRIKDYMVRSKKLYEKQTLMPRIDQAAAKRFIKSGLWTPNTSASEETCTETTSSRKRKREPDDDENED